MSPIDLHALASAIVAYDPDRDPARVTIYGAGVGVSRCLSGRDATAARVALHVAIRQHLSAVLGLDEDALDPMVRRLVTIAGSDDHSRYSVVVCGSELVGQEEPATAESRARSMRAVLVAELQRALDEQIPATVRRPVPASLEAR